MSNFHLNALNLYLAECTSFSINESDLLGIDLSTALHKRHKVPRSYLAELLTSLFQTAPLSIERKIAAWNFAITSGGAYTAFDQIYSDITSKCQVIPYWNIRDSDLEKSCPLATGFLNYDSFCLDEPINLFSGPAQDNMANGNSIDLHYIEYAGTNRNVDFYKTSMLTESKPSTQSETSKPSQGMQILTHLAPNSGRGRPTSILSAPQTRSLTPVSRNIQQNIAQQVPPQDIIKIREKSQAAKLAGINHFNDLIKNLEVKNPIDNSEIKKTTIYKRLEVTRDSWNHCMQIMINEIDSAIGASSVTNTNDSTAMRD